MTAGGKGKPLAGAALIAAKCPSCGGILSIKKGGEVRCDFCGGEFFLHESYKGKSKEIRNYYELAYAAQETGDAADAYKYFTKILELDSGEALAWYGKAIASLDYAKARGMRTAEALTLFKRALANAEGDERERLRETIRGSCFYCADSAFEYFRNRGLLGRGNDREVWALFDFADEVLPLNNEQMKRLVTVLCKYYTPSYSEKKDRVNHYTERIRVAEPEYLNPWEEEGKRWRTLPGKGRRRFVIPLLIFTLAFFVVCLIFYLLSIFLPVD